MIPSNRCLNQAMVSSFLIRCEKPTRAFCCLRLATRAPGRPMTTKKSIPKIPMPGSYRAPKSICSWIPKPKFPVSEKFPLRNSYSFTFSPRSRISSAFGPRMVTCTAIFSLRRIPNVRTVNRAFDVTGVWPVSCSKTLEARVRRSPDSPTEMSVLSQ